MNREPTTNAPPPLWYLAGVGKEADRDVMRIRSFSRIFPAVKLPRKVEVGAGFPHSRPYSRVNHGNGGFS